MTRTNPNGLRARQRLGKYRIVRRLGEGGFATVYAAADTIEGINVAIKVPFGHYMSDEVKDWFRQEVRLAARLEHPNILGVKDASVIDDRFVIVTLLGQRSLHDRLKNRVSVETALSFASQMISAVACAHEHNIVHCDIKPDNFILFDDARIRLADFGIAKVSRKTIEASGTGTVGHMAPEQAMGKPSFRSDVFSLGLIIYRMLSGSWPEYPFEWPPVGVSKMRKKHVHPEVISFLRKAMQLKPRDRFSNASKMEEVFTPLHVKAIRHLRKKRG